VLTACSFAAVAEEARQLQQFPSHPNGSDIVREMTLEECLDAAMENNHRRPASRFAVAMAEAQHRQALAGHWPHLAAKGGYQRMDEAPNFVFPSGTAVVTVLDRHSQLCAGVDTAAVRADSARPRFPGGRK
jgi:outer membrane protein TolC